MTKVEQVGGGREVGAARLVDGFRRPEENDNPRIYRTVNTTTVRNTSPASDEVSELNPE